jgi:hypothetical protein
VSGPNAPAAVSSQQSYRTPPDFLARVKRRLGWDAIDADLACETHNCVGRLGFRYDQGVDALATDWRVALEPHDRLRCFLNPPFSKAGAFARKCAESGATIAALVPVALGTKWWRQYVHERAVVLGVGRIRFNLPDGTPMPTAINRDCALLVYGWHQVEAVHGEGYYPLEDWSKW